MKKGIKGVELGITLLGLALAVLVGFSIHTNTVSAVITDNVYLVNTYSNYTTSLDYVKLSSVLIPPSVPIGTEFYVTCDRYRSVDSGSQKFYVELRNNQGTVLGTEGYNDSNTGWFSGYASGVYNVAYSGEIIEIWGHKTSGSVGTVGIRNENLNIKASPFAVTLTPTEMTIVKSNNPAYIQLHQTAWLYIYNYTAYQQQYYVNWDKIAGYYVYCELTGSSFGNQQHGTVTIQPGSGKELPFGIWSIQNNPPAEIQPCEVTWIATNWTENVAISLNGGIISPSSENFTVTVNPTSLYIGGIYPDYQQVDLTLANNENAVRSYSILWSGDSYGRVGAAQNSGYTYLSQFIQVDNVEALQQITIPFTAYMITSIEGTATTISVTVTCLDTGQQNIATIELHKYVTGNNPNPTPSGEILGGWQFWVMIALMSGIPIALAYYIGFSGVIIGVTLGATISFIIGVLPSWGLVLICIGIGATFFLKRGGD